MKGCKIANNTIVYVPSPFLFYARNTIGFFFFFFLLLIKIKDNILNTKSYVQLWDFKYTKQGREVPTKTKYSITIPRAKIAQNPKTAQLT